MSDHFDAIAKSYESDLSLARCELSEAEKSLRVYRNNWLQTHEDFKAKSHELYELEKEYEATLNALGFKEEADTVDVIDRIARLLEAERDLEEMRQCVCE